MQGKKKSARHCLRHYSSLVCMLEVSSRWVKFPCRRSDITVNIMSIRKCSSSPNYFDSVLSSVYINNMRPTYTGKALLPETCIFRLRASDLSICNLQTPHGPKSIVNPTALPQPSLNEPLKHPGDCDRGKLLIPCLSTATAAECFLIVLHRGQPNSMKLSTAPYSY